MKELQTSQPQVSLDLFIRASGFLFFLFGLLAVVFRIVQFFIIGDPPLEVLVLTDGFLILQGIPSLLAAIFFLSGVTALYLRQANSLGVAGLIIYFLTFSALVISSGAMFTYAFTAPELAREAPDLLTSASSGIIQAVLVSMGAGQVGWLILIALSFRTRIVPRWALLVAILSIFMVIIMTPLAQTQLMRFIYNVLLGAGPLAVGYVLWRNQLNSP